MRKLQIKNKLSVFVAVSLLVSVVGALFFRQNSGVTTLDDRLSVVASFYPLSNFASQIGGDKVKVVNLTPAGVEPHDFEPSPRDLASLQKSALFIYNGAGFEPWVEKVLADLANSNAKVVNATQKIDLHQTGEDPEHEEDENDDKHNDGDFDPHAWQDPVLAKVMVENIKLGLISKDPQNESYYQKNAENYVKELENLDAEYKNGLASCESRNVVVSHNAFGYLAERYELNIVPISGLSPDEEPSPSKMAEIVEFVKANNVSYIFFETLISPKLSETIANETGAQTATLNPLEGLSSQELDQGLDYLSVSRQNLSNLREALNCK